MTRLQAIEAFVAQHVPKPFALEPLQGDASFRRYVRVSQGTNYWMVMDAPPEHEDVSPFVKVANGLLSGGFSTPRILTKDMSQGFLLSEDLGDDTFARLLKKDSANETTYYKAAVELLAHWHQGGLASAGLGDLPRYDVAVYTREIQLFSQWFLPQILSGAALMEAQESYVNVWNDLLKIAPLQTNQFVHRDYHADNLMWLPARSGHARVGLLDFQDALIGDAAYDVVSLLEDARRDVSPALAAEMLAHYMALTGQRTEAFSVNYGFLAAQRNSKIIGIFTRLAARDGKQNYLSLLPRVWAHLANDVKHPLLAPLAAWLEKYVPASARGIIPITKNAQMLGLVA